MPNLINDSFAKLLRRPVTLKVNESEIILQFEATGLRVADNNAQGVFLHRETNWMRLVFPNGQRSLDAVFTFLHDGEDDAISLAPYFEEAVHGERNADP